VEVKSPSPSKDLLDVRLRSFVCPMRWEDTLGRPSDWKGEDMDAITLLREDHQKVRKLFREFEGAGEAASTEKRRIVDQIVEELTVHAFIEEQLFYPAVQRLENGGKGEAPEDLVKEAQEEHAQVKRLLAELETMSPEDERFDAKVTVVIDDVSHHAEEEENEMFPKVRDLMGRNDLQDLGQRMAELKARAPRLPSEVVEA
jgi:hemerythrin superfamily protein